MIIVVLFILIIIILGLFNKVDFSNSFFNGVKSSYKSIINLLPNIMFLILALNIFLNSGIISILEVFCERMKLIPEVIIQLILRPLSNSASMMMMVKIFEKYGVNSFLGNLSSVIQASSDTTIYIIMIYFSSIGVKKISNSLLIALLTNIITFIFGILFSYIIFTYF